MPTTEEILQQTRIQVESAVEMERLRFTNQTRIEAARIDIELIRMAHHTLTENKRSLPVDQRNITSEEILEFKNSLKSGITSLQDPQ
jgi:hypothetical protein